MSFGMRWIWMMKKMIQEMTDLLEMTVTMVAGVEDTPTREGMVPEGTFEPFKLQLPGMMLSPRLRKWKLPKRSRHRHPLHRKRKFPKPWKRNLLLKKAVKKRIQSGIPQMEETETEKIMVMMEEDWQSERQTW